MDLDAALARQLQVNVGVSCGTYETDKCGQDLLGFYLKCSLFPPAIIPQQS